MNSKVTSEDQRHMKKVHAASKHIKSVKRESSCRNIWGSQQRFVKTSADRGQNKWNSFLILCNIHVSSIIQTFWTQADLNTCAMVLFLVTSRAHLNVLLNCQRSCCIVGNAGGRFWQGRRMHGRKKKIFLVLLNGFLSLFVRLTTVEGVQCFISGAIFQVHTFS